MGGKPWFWASFWSDLDQMLTRFWPDVWPNSWPGFLARFFWSENTVYSPTGTENYSLAVPPGRRKATGKQCIKHPILLSIPYIKGPSCIVGTPGEGQMNGATSGVETPIDEVQTQIKHLSLNFLTSCRRIWTKISQNEALAIPYVSIRLWPINSKGKRGKTLEDKIGKR